MQLENTHYIVYMNYHIDQQRAVGVMAGEALTPSESDLQLRGLFIHI